MTQSLRHITKNQFSNLTTIDGERLNDALQDLENIVNKVPLGDLDKRFVRNVFAINTLTEKQTNNIENTIPFLSASNTGSHILPGTQPPEKFANPQRLKGADEHPAAQKVVWTSTYFFSKPCVLDTVNVWLCVDTEHVNALSYSASPPPSKVAHAPVDDIDVVVSVGDIFQPENRSLDSVIFAKHKFPAHSERFSRIEPINVIDMKPAHNGVNGAGQDGTIDGMCMLYEHLNVPIHAGSTVRLQIAAPRWQHANDPWSINPTVRGVWKAAIVTLESLE